MGTMKCRHKTVMAFGITQLIFGIIILLCGIAVVVKQSWVETVYHGIWGGVLIILCGSLGMFGGAAKKKVSVFVCLNFKIKNFNEIYFK